MKEIIEYGLLVILGGYAIKKKFFDSKKSEYETMDKALQVWKGYTQDLTERVNVLTEEIAELRRENHGLRKEIQNLETLLKYRQ